jgi:hypothetical protein
MEGWQSKYQPNSKTHIVSPGFLKGAEMGLPDIFSTNDTETVVFVLVDNKLAGYIALPPNNKYLVRCFRIN